MSRKNRVIYEGAIYHIYQRGNNKEYIFQDDNVKSFILRCLKKYNIKFDYEILAYVIMDNHYHLLMKTNKSPINEIMFYLDNLLGKYIKGILNRTGHAFDSRYKSKLVDNNAYLVWLLRYIHRNPIKADICDSLEDYPWSSHYFYKNNINSGINANFILNILENSRERASKQYLKLVNSPGDEIDEDKDYEITKAALNLKETPFSNGGKDFSNFIRLNHKSLDEVISKLNINKSTLMEIRNGTRKQCHTAAKIKIIRCALSECYSLKEIAEYFNAAPSTISKLISRNKIV